MSVAETRRKSNQETTTLMKILITNVVVFSILCSISNSQSNELQALMKLKASLMESSPNKAVQKLFSSWDDQTSICQNFTGILCDTEGFVTEIDLSNQQLSGSVPFDAICSLKSLEKLSLGQNSLVGIISDDLRNCTGLKFLDLGFNFFSGKVPDLSSLTELKLLSLNACSLSGSFPWKSLRNLTSLEFLSLGDNPFDPSPFPEEVLKLQNLYWLYLTNSSLAGKFPPDIGNLTLLQNLELSDNRLTGDLPPSLSKLVNLWQLELYDNHLTGKLPEGFGNLTMLVNFDASANSLSGDLSELRSLKSLAWLQLFENELVGEIPAEFGQMRNLSSLALYRNKLSGEIPKMIGSWSGMDFIDLSENYLTGEIPPEMCKYGIMTELLLQQNRLSGDIPASYGSCTSLNRFLVNNNSLSGLVPEELWGLPNLVRLDLSMNQFEGRVSPEIGKAKSLGQLVLSRNRFSGEIPGEISGAVSLVSIEASFNDFGGKIPAEIGKLDNLSSLFLDNNRISGEIPSSLGSCVSISQINLARNSLSGGIPASLGSLPNLNSLNLSENGLSGNIPNTLSSLKLNILDLSRNRLTGPIPGPLSIAAFNESFIGNPGLYHSATAAEGSGDSSRRRKLLSSFIALTLVSLLSLACFLVVKLLKRNHCQRSSSSWSMKPFHVLSFTEREIVESIKPENLIAKGGSGHVYRVCLKGGRGDLAVKQIWAAAAASESGDRRACRSTVAMLKNLRGSSSEYGAEVAALSSVRHVNVVKLYCSITSEDSDLLVYEYMPNGSLWDRLHTCGKGGMDWGVRYDVAVGAARGLEYLHHGCVGPVVHRDVKSSNILLDENWKPRIADFGLAKIIRPGADWTRVIAGTLGYIAPEYAYAYKVNEKSDVYSFGVVLMELVTGKRPIEPEFGENKDIVNWVYTKLKTRENVLDLVDPTISESLKESAVNVLRVAIHCTAQVPTLRPSMRTVVQMLEEAEPSKLKAICVVKDGENNCLRESIVLT